MHWCREQDFVVFIQKCWISAVVLCLTARLGQNIARQSSGERKKVFKDLPVFSLTWISGAKRFWRRRAPLLRCSEIRAE